MGAISPTQPLVAPPLNIQFILTSEPSNGQYCSKPAYLINELPLLSNWKVKIDILWKKS